MPKTTRVTFPPPIEDRQLRQWLGTCADAINALPSFSVFSVTTPESNETAERGTIGINEATDTSARLWVKEIGSGTTGWASLSTN